MIDHPGAGNRAPPTSEPPPNEPQPTQTGRSRHERPYRARHHHRYRRIHTVAAGPALGGTHRRIPERTTLQLVYAVGAPVDYGPGISATAFDKEAMQADGAALLHTAQKTAREAVTDPDHLRIESVIAGPPPAPVLIERSAGAFMIVVGTHGYGAVGRTLLGSVSSSLIRHAHCPVAVIPDISGGDIAEHARRPVLVGVDGSAGGALALDIAFDEAARRGVGVIAVTVWSEFLRYISRAEMAEKAQAIQAESLTEFAEQYPHVDVVRIVAEDRPAGRLLQEAGKAQMVVVGNRGRGGFAGMALGSVVRAVVHRSEVPVIVARPRA